MIRNVYIYITVCNLQSAEKVFNIVKLKVLKTFSLPVEQLLFFKSNISIVKILYIVFSKSQDIFFRNIFL